MLTQTITHHGREYHLATSAADMLGITVATLMKYTRNGLAHVDHDAHRYINIDEAAEYMADRTRMKKRGMQPVDDATIDGRLYHPMRWYRVRYKISWEQLAALPCVRVGGRQVYIAEEDFMEKYGEVVK